jgi:hypothetical protein
MVVISFIVRYYEPPNFGQRYRGQVSHYFDLADPACR